MANELKARGQTSGATYYALIIRNSDNQYRRSSDGAFEAYNGANYASQYAHNAAAANGQGDYLQNAPVLPAGSYDIKIRERIGGSPAETDPDAVYAYTVYSDGTAIVDILAKAAALPATNLVTAIWDDPDVELTAVPLISASKRSMLKWIFTVLRNKTVQNDTQQIVYKDDGTTVLGTAPVSDSGTTTTRGEFA